MTIPADDITDRGAQADVPWTHVHPLTPLLRGGVMITGAIGYWLSTQFDNLFGRHGDDPTQGHLLQIAGVGLVIVVLVVAGSWVSWRNTTYRLGPTTVELRHGIVNRQHRQVRYDRIQAVDVTRPLLARLAGLSSVRIEAAGGRDSNIELSYLPQTRAAEVRQALLRAAAGQGSEVFAGDPSGSPRDAGSGLGGTEKAGGEGVAGEAPASPAGGAATAGGERTAYGHDVGEVPIARIPAMRVWAATLLSFNAAFLVLAIPALVVALVTGSLLVLPWLGPMVLGALGQQVGRFSTWMNFRVDASGSAIRIRHGLTELRTTTVPLHRIQAVEISQPALWRAVDWWRIEVNVAGVHRDPDEKGDNALIPVGTRAEALAILAAMGPRWSLPEVIEGMDAPGPSPSFVGIPPNARVLDPLSWKRIGYAVTSAALVSRGGWLGRRVQLVPHARVQSLTLDQGPLERRLGLANVKLHSTTGPVDPVVRHLALAEATRLLNAEAVRAAGARAVESGGAGNPPAATAPLPCPGALSSLGKVPAQAGSQGAWTE
ncbi:PH domain-containing protein [Nostocoides vanveenii]|uniref:PH domain-containing protein n=1 Tax=Nostocoides vanveenii TaxID=330835 RepID=A0ABP4XCC0_9MICO